MKKIIDEPLLHFLLLGFLLFLYYEINTPDSENQNKTIIDISTNEIAKMKTEYKNEYAKEIDENHLQALIAKKYYEKLLIDEAISLTLHTQNETITQKLLQQMESIMLSSDLSEPSEKELYDYYIKNQKEYSQINTLSFSQVFFSNRADKKIAPTLQLLQIADITPSKASSFGETTTLANSLKNINYEELKEQYGNYFASQIFKLKQGIWHKEILSKHGVHLIYISDKNISTPYPFDEVQDRVYKDYLQEQKKSKKDESYKLISAQFLLRVEE
ncbi:MAG: peptidylprolyl isomerase [Campylobacterota bacterium]|nr:peptidylprolyl isomerase [Campylobacterota bacterium]